MAETILVIAVTVTQTAITAAGYHCLVWSHQLHRNSTVCLEIPF